MKKLRFFLAMVAVAGLALAVSYNVFAAESAEQEITDLEHKCIAATSTDELAKLGCFDENDIVVYDFAGPLEYSGAKAVRGDFDNFFNNTKDAKGEFLQLNVVTDGKLGVARSIQHFTWTSKDGKAMAATFRVTDAWHKTDGKWKIFHTHVSVPIDPATGKPEMDLKL